MPTTPTGDAKIPPIAAITISAAVIGAFLLLIVTFTGPEPDTWEPYPTDLYADAAETTDPNEIYSGVDPDFDPHAGAAITPANDRERALLTAMDSIGGDASDGTLEDARLICGGDPPTINDIIDAREFGFDYSAEFMELAIRHLCPKYVPLINKAKNSFGDGEYTVGDDIKPGTYRTSPRITDCYWERSTAGGDIIANNFINNAPRGVTVTVHTGEGFTSEGCGFWTRA